MVETGNLTADPVDIVVGFSNHAAALEMMVHLVGSGHRTLGLIGAAVAGNPLAADRRREYDEAGAAHGLTRAPTLTVECSSDLEAGPTAMVRICERQPEVTAIFAVSEVRASGALLECQCLGWPVPGRIAIAGFNGAGMGAWLVPALTTVRIPRQEIGRRAAQMILDRLKGRAIAEAQVDIGFDLAVRGNA